MNFVKEFKALSEANMEMASRIILGQESASEVVRDMYEDGKFEAF